MNLQPEQATFLAHVFLNQIESEQKTTSRVLAAIPSDHQDYRPDPKAKTAMELGWHIASSDVWFMDSVVAGAFNPGGGREMPKEIKSSADLAAWYDQQFAASAAKGKALSGDHLAKPMNFFNVFNMPGVMYLNFLALHMVHHRGQLSTYLRPMGGKVPSIYGGSADEPFQMPATA
jgi:uncharacterized damage-inducible protein DinB